MKSPVIVVAITLRGHFGRGVAVLAGTRKSTGISTLNIPAASPRNNA
jgi:hypothetical protein